MIIGLPGTTQSYQMVYNDSMTFTKGQRGWNKGNKIKGEWRNCLLCGTRKWFTQYRIDHGGGKFCTLTCSNRTRALKKGPEHWNYKGSMTYGAIHDWLRDTFGLPGHCSICGKQGEKRKGIWNIQWALKHGKKYERKTENFLWLCIWCHLEYDKTSVKNRPTWNKGRPWSPEQRKKISEGLKRYFASL